MGVTMLDRALYNTILAQTYSPCGRYLLAGNTYGQLAIFDLDRVINPSPESLNPNYNKPKRVHSIDGDGQVCSLVTTERFLVVGTIGEISGWDWKAIIHNNTIKPAWVIKIPSNKSLIEQRDVNSLWLGEDEATLYAGCGDNNVHAFHLEDGRLLRTYEGHTDYVHSVHGKGQQLVSASEDGCVKLWDVRSERASHTLEPHARSELARTDLGKWVGAASLSDDWIVCGGGPRLALWHLRSLDPLTVFALPDHGVHVAAFAEPGVLAGGAARNLHLLTLAGETAAELPVSAATVYSAAVRPPLASAPATVLCLAGSSDRIDLCTSFSYRDQILQWR